MNPRCICIRGNTAALFASAALALGITTQTQAQCANDSGAGDHAEGEPCLLNNAANQTSDGCNLVPNLFDELGAANFVGGAQCPASTTCVRVCGVASTYDAPGTTPCIQNSDCVSPNLPTCQAGFCLVNRRDTDWHRISFAALDAADVDNNGAVQIRSHIVSEFDSVTFFVSIGNPACAAVSVLNSVGCGGPQGSADAVETVIINDHPNGIVAFAAPGLCTGGGIFDGFECGDAPPLTDYIQTISLKEPPTACADPATNPNLLPCNTPNGIPGCNDPSCCKQVCASLPLCCVTAWAQNCATSAVNLGCAPAQGGPICIKTGINSAADGFLQVCTDPQGGWADPSFGGMGDLYNPIGAAPAAIASFTHGFIMYRAAAMQHEILSNNIDWKSALNDDGSLSTTIECVVGGPNCVPGSVATDTNGDTALDHLVSKIRVTGVGVDVRFNITQDVKLLPNLSGGGGTVGVLSQIYSMTNNLAGAISFVLLRQCDFDLVWPSPAPDPDDFNDDSVGTGTNGSPLTRHISQGEQGPNAAFITISSPTGAQYVGAKGGIDPDLGGPAPPFGAGTDTQEWAAFGVPTGWGNFIATIGANTNGYSLATQAGDGHIDLEVPVTIPGNGTVAISFDTTYGSKNPLGVGTCPWDCGPPPDNSVGVVDFLALLAQWPGPGSCDFDGGGVGITDFLKLLAHWGPCP